MAPQIPTLAQLFLVAWTMSTLYLISGGVNADTVTEKILFNLRANANSDQSADVSANLEHSLKGKDTNICPNSDSYPILRTDKYYVIQLDDGTYMSYGSAWTDMDAAAWTKRLYTPGHRVQRVSSSDLTQRELHWRLIDKGNNQYVFVSGKSGQSTYYLWDNTRTYDQLLATGNQEGAVAFSKCDGVGRFQMYMPSLGATNGAAKPHRERAQISFTAQSWTEYWTTSCCNSCGDEGGQFIRENKMACFVCDTEDCYRTVNPPTTCQTSINFYINELTNYRAPDVINGPIKATTNSANQYLTTTVAIISTAISVVNDKLNYGSYVIQGTKIVNKFGMIAKVASVGLGVLGIALSIAVDLATPDLQTQLNELEQRIMDNVKKLIDDNLVSVAYKDALSQVDEIRTFLLTQYRQSKKSAFSLPAGDYRNGQIDDLADSVSQYGNQFLLAITQLLPEGIGSTIPDTDLSAKFIQSGFDLYSTTIMEMVATKQEAVLVNAYMDSTTDCNQLIKNEGLDVQVTRQLGYLQKMQTFVINRRTRMIRYWKNNGQYTGYTARDDFLGQDIFYTGNDWDGGSAEWVVNKAKDEVTWDMQRYSYNLIETQNAMNAAISRTVEICGLLRSDPATRTQFEQCARMELPSCQPK